MAGELTTIARPYAEAAFQYAQDNGHLDLWSEALANLSAVSSNPDIRSQIHNPNLSRDRVLDLVLAVSAIQLPTGLNNLCRLLAENNRLFLLSEISALFEERRIASQGVQHVLVRSAFPVDAAQEHKLSQSLAMRLGARVELTLEHDPDLIGGLEIKAGDLVIDDSVRAKLQQLSHALQL